jgi:hypothetical protein
MLHHTYGDAVRRGDDLRADAERYRIGEGARRARTARIARTARTDSTGGAGHASAWIRRAAARVALATALVALRLASGLDASVPSDELPGRVSTHRS